MTIRFFFKILILFVVVIKYVQNCGVKTFYNNSVTVVGVKGLNTIDGCFEPKDSLVNISYIQIVNESVPIIYEDAINNLPNLVDILLDSDGIRELRSGCFKNLTNLKFIRLKHNNISRISNGVFENLPIKELDLSSNNIETIHPDAFDSMTNLNSINLNDNRIKQWSNGWFKRTPNLYNLHFENNLITTIPSKAFENLKGEHYISFLNLNVSTNLYFDNNKIRVIEDLAFDGLEILGWLFLQRNQINDIRISVLGSLKSISWLRLDHNQLTCIPKQIIDVSPKVVYYLTANPLSQECSTFLAQFATSKIGRNTT